MKIIIELSPDKLTDDIIELVRKVEANDRRRVAISRFIADNYAAGNLTSDDVGYLKDRLAEIGLDDA